MSKQDKTQENGLEKMQADVVERGREVWLAGLGAFAMVEDEGTKLFNNLVEQGQAFMSRGKAKAEQLDDETRQAYDDLVKRGEAVKDKSVQQITNVVDDLQTKQTQVAKKIEDRVADVVEKALSRLDVPTRTETATLTQKVDELAAKVEALTATLVAQETPAKKATRKRATPKAAAKTGN